MLKIYLILLFSFFTPNLFAQNIIATYGSEFWGWAEFTFYDNNTFEHKISGHMLNNGKFIKKDKKTKGDYLLKGDTIFITSKLQNTYSHGNISPKFLLLNDSVILDLELCYDYTKFSSLKTLLDTVFNEYSKKNEVRLLSPYYSKIHPLKFPYIPVKTSKEKEKIVSIFEKIFERKEITSFFKSDSTILARFFFKTEIEKIGIKIPNKNLKFIRAIHAKQTSPKRLEFNNFVILEERKTIFVNFSLFGEKRSGIYKCYAMEYVEKEGEWKLKSVKKLK